MHRALTALLDLGASPDLRDAVALTPLYHACMTGGSTRCAELLLQDHAQIGVVDKSTWSEVHQATKHGHIGHLYLLCVYVPRSFRLPPFVTSKASAHSCAVAPLLLGVDPHPPLFLNAT